MEYNWINSTTISISNLNYLAEGCSNITEEDFFDDYHNVLLPNSQPTAEQTFSIVGSGNDASLTLTNEDGEVAVFNRADVTDDNLLGNWYLHAINIDGTPYESNEPSYLYDYYITNFSSNEFYASICTYIWSEFYLDYGNKIGITEYSHTFEGCDNSDSAYDYYWAYDIFLNDESVPIVLDYTITGTGNDAILVLMDFEGDFAVYGRQTLSSPDHQLAAGLKMSPNPANDAIKISYEGAIETIDYQIFDINGKEIISSKLEASKLIDIRRLQAGIYFLKLKSGNLSKTSKFVKL